MFKFKKSDTTLALSNTASQFLIKIITSSTSFLVTLAIAYFFGVKSFGSFTKVITFVSFFYLLVDFGINSVFLKDHYENIGKNFSNLVFLRTAMSFTLVIIVIFVTFFLPYDSIKDTGFSQSEKLWIIIFSFTIFTQGLFYSINSIFQKNFSYHLSIIPSLLASFCILLFVVFAVQAKNMLFIFLSYPVEGVIYFASSYFLVKNRFSLKSRVKNLQSFSTRLLTSSLPLGLMLFLNLVYFRADTLILSFYKPSGDVGVYGFSFKMFEFIIAFPTFFSNSVYPLLIEREKSGKDFYPTLRKYSIFLLSLSIIFMAGVFIFSPLIKYFRSDLSSTVLPLKILSFSIPFFFLTSLLQWTFVIKGKKLLLLLIYFVSMILNIVLNMIFIPRFGYIAASYITVVSEGVVLFLMALFLFLFISKRENVKIVPETLNTEIVSG